MFFAIYVHKGFLVILVADSNSKGNKNERYF